jgi:hypothetical protein
VVLDFGQPWKLGADYGAYLFSPLAFANTSQIAGYVESFAQGYWICALDEPGSPHLDLAVGTTTYGGSNNPTYVTYEHGQAWADMVDGIISWIHSCGQGCDYSSRISVAGAIDIELVWSPKNVARAWADGYDSTNGISNYYYNYGTCEGCPYTFPWGGGHPDWAPSNGWSVDDIWYVSSHGPAWAFPEIYNPNQSQAYQWQNISLYGAVFQDFPLTFKGSMTQYQACQDHPLDCNGMDNDPGEGWIQLYEALNSDTRTSQPALHWSTDITWNN